MQRSDMARLLRFALAKYFPDDNTNTNATGIIPDNELAAEQAEEKDRQEFKETERRGFLIAESRPCVCPWCNKDIEQIKRDNRCAD